MEIVTFLLNNDRPHDYLQFHGIRSQTYMVVKHMISLRCFEFSLLFVKTWSKLCVNFSFCLFGILFGHTIHLGRNNNDNNNTYVMHLLTISGCLTDLIFPKVGYRK